MNGIIIHYKKHLLVITYLPQVDALQIINKRRVYALLQNNLFHRPDIYPLTFIAVKMLSLFLLFTLLNV